MKIAVIIVRVLLGLLFLFASISYFLQLFPEQKTEGNHKIFLDGMAASGYLLPLVKAFELLCGIAFVVGRFVPLATVVLFPITVNIVLVHASLAPDGLPFAIGVLLAHLFLAYACRKNYESLLAPRIR
jgi:uncharacterized membrane protein YphA (DoxX/SURF4 family)